jgi:poly(A) polymerase
LAAERVGAEMRRMLGLPRVAKTLRAMATTGIVDLAPETLDALQGYERRARRPELSARLALISRATGSDTLQRMWRLSNDDLRLAETTLAAAELIADFQLNEAAYRYPAALGDAIEVAATLADWSDAGRQAVLDQLQRLEVPTFPLGGADLIGRGLKPGKALGAELERLERTWIESGFTLDRQALLGLVRVG